MGEIADMMIGGEMCQYCGEYLGDGDGYPRSCAGCASEDDGKPGIRKVKIVARSNNSAPLKHHCPMCGKRVSPQGMGDHVMAVHKTTIGTVVSLWGRP